MSRASGTLQFIGVSTAGSSIQTVFPRWAEVLGLDARLEGVDLPLHAPREQYRQAVRRLHRDPSIAGALVTTHKLDLHAAAADLFARFDPLARLCGEVSCISKGPGGELVGHAKDPITAGLALDALVPPGHWQQTGAEVLCLGAGGAAIAIGVHLSRQAQRPSRFTAVDVLPTRLDHLRDIQRRLDGELPFRTLLNTEPADNDALLAELPVGSLVINATGMGKDRPGSPISDRGTFPSGGLVWELNYRGELGFLHQAQRQQRQRELRVEDGWRYFLHGWTQVIAEVFGIEMTAEVFAALDREARALRR